MCDNWVKQAGAVSKVPSGPLESSPKPYGCQNIQFRIETAYSVIFFEFFKISFL